MANELDAYKSEQTKLLEAQRARAQESAYINHQKLLKYLEQSSASKGYSVGMTESAKIAAANKYSQDVAAADATYNQGMGELNNYLRTEQERLDDKAKAEQEKLEAKQKAEQDEIYGEVMTKIESGEFNTTTELSSYLNDKTIDTDGDGVAESSFLDLMSPVQRATVQGKLSYYQKKLEQIAADNAYDSQKTLTVSQGKATDVGGYLSKTNAGNNFTIGGYKVELGDAAAEGAVPADKIANVADKVPFAYNGAIYIKINGTVYAVRGRGGKLDSDGYKDALKYLTNPSAGAQDAEAKVEVDPVTNKEVFKASNGQTYPVEKDPITNRKGFRAPNGNFYYLD